MASTKAYLDFVLEQLSGLDEISSRAMMGAFILYYRGRIFGGIYDDRLLVKPVPMALRLMPDAEMERPYDGAKEMILVDNVEDRQFLRELVESMWEELPEKKKIFLLDRKADVDIYHMHLQSREFICLQQFFVEN